MKISTYLYKAWLWAGKIMKEKHHLFNDNFLYWKLQIKKTNIVIFNVFSFVFLFRIYKLWKKKNIKHLRTNKEINNHIKLSSLVKVKEEEKILEYQINVKNHKEVAKTTSLAKIVKNHIKK